MKPIKEFIKGLKLPGWAGIIGFLGAFAGSDGTSKMWRRAGIPALTTVVAYVTLGFQLGWIKSLLSITCMSLWGALAIGHGIPSDNDEGSVLGRFYYRLFKENHLLADIFTRGTIGIIQSISLISLPILKGNWFVYFICSLGIILGQAITSWRSWGVQLLKMGNKTYHLLWSDIVNYSIMGTMIYLIIKF